MSNAGRLLKRSRSPYVVWILDKIGGQQNDDVKSSEMRRSEVVVR